MRTNLPVTQQEYQFPGNETLLSTTDTASHISYANAAFIRTSGYATDELMGQPHNLVGYLSVRVKPSRAEVDATEALYRRFKEGRAAGLAFHRGLIVRIGLMRWASALQLLPAAWRVRLPLLLVGAAVGVALSWSGLGGVAMAAMGATLAASLLLADSAWFCIAFPREATPSAPSPMVAGPACTVAGCAGTVWASAVTAERSGEFGANTQK